MTQEKYHCLFNLVILFILVEIFSLAKFQLAAVSFDRDCSPHIVLWICWDITSTTRYDALAPQYEIIRAEIESHRAIGMTQK